LLEHLIFIYFTEHEISAKVNFPKMAQNFVEIILTKLCPHVKLSVYRNHTLTILVFQVGKVLKQPRLLTFFKSGGAYTGTGTGNSKKKLRFRSTKLRIIDKK
jgi:hypothetical protein